jgi:hypothetical protein
MAGTVVIMARRKKKEFTDAEILEILSQKAKRGELKKLTTAEIKRIIEDVRAKHGLPPPVKTRRKKEKGFTVRVSPILAAEEAKAKGIHHDLSPDEKEAKLAKLLKYDFAEVIQDGIVKQRTHYNRLASC